MFKQPSFMGQAPIHLGQPTVSVAPTVHNGGGVSPQNLEFAFWRQGWPQWPYPPAYPHAYPQRKQRLICRKLEERSEEEGRDVMECRYETVPPVEQVQLVTYPVVRLFPIF